MKFAHIRDRIANNPGFRTLEEVRRAGYRIYIFVSAFHLLPP